MSTSIKPPVAGISKRVPTISFEKKFLSAAKGDKTGVTINFDGPVPEPVKLEINRGSFSPDRKIQKSILDPGALGIYKLKIYSSGQFGQMHLKVDGNTCSSLNIRPTTFQSIFFDWMPTIIAAIITALIIKSFGVASYFIPSESMVPTLLIHDRLLVNRFSYRFGLAHPQRGDIFVFKPPINPKTDFIKRVIGVPGDELQIKDGAVYINGEKLVEDYIKDQPEYILPNSEFEYRFKESGIISTNKDGEPVLKIPKGQYLMLGDNRNDSRDSHVWGLLDEKGIEGKALFVFWPPSRIKILGDRPLLDAVTGHPANAASNNDTKNPEVTPTDPKVDKKAADLLKSKKAESNDSK